MSAESKFETSVVSIKFQEKQFILEDRKGAWGSQPHTHNMNELYYVVNGKVRIYIKDNYYDLGEGNIALVPMEVPHKTIALSLEHSKFVANFSDADVRADILERVKELFSEDCRIVPLKKRVNFERIFTEIEQENKTMDAYSKEVVDGLLNKLFIYIIRYLSENNTKFEAKMPKYIVDATKYISENYGKNIDLNEVAEYAHVNKAYLSRKFKEVMSIGLSEYINTLRITAAKEMLLNTDKSITEVAMNCGFNDSSYFALLFKQQIGESPLKYRKMRLKK